MKWISVKDKLPELDSRVLVIEQNGEVQICNYCKSFWNNTKLKRKNAIGFLDEQDEQPSRLYPTHWMLLPNKPKIEKQLHSCDCTDYNGKQCYNCLNGFHKGCSAKCSQRNSKQMGVKIIMKK